MRGTVRYRGSTWSYQVGNGHHPDGRRRWITKGGYRTKKEAQRALTELLGELDRGSYVQPSRERFADFVEQQWLPAIQASVRGGTYSGYSRDMRTYVLPTLGGLRMQDVTAGRLTALYSTLLKTGRKDGEGLSAKTVRNVHGTVHRCLTDACQWGALARNPADQATVPQAQRSEMKVWTAHQLGTFLAFTVDHQFHVGWLLGGTTGMRRGEILGLRWSDVDLDAARLTITQTLILVDQKPTVGRPKTNAGRRSVALDQATVAALRRHRVRQSEQRLAWGGVWRDTSWVVTSEGGSEANPQTFSKSFVREAEKADLPRIRLHDLRHTWASLALQANISTKIVSQRLGHASIAITLDTYSHVLPGMDRDAADTVAGAIFG